jgi:hypothetical protein
MLIHSASSNLTEGNEGDSRGATARAEEVCCFLSGGIAEDGAQLGCWSDPTVEPSCGAD